MALPVAIQSVVFYYLACTPCMSARTRHRAKKKFDKERKEREALEEDEPPLYRHPSPFNVNPYWQEEIMMGPSLPKKGRAAKQNASQRKLTSAGQESSVATHSSLAISSHGSGGVVLQGTVNLGSGDGSTGPDPSAAGAAGDGLTTAETAATTAAARTTTTTTTTTTPADGSSSDVNTSNNGSGASIAANNNNNNNNTTTTQTKTSRGQQPPASPTLTPDDARSMSLLEATATAVTATTTANASVEGWNYKRYQREDEELWGLEPSSRTHKLMDAIVKAGSSAGRLLESTLGNKERSSSSAAGMNVTDRDRANFYATTVIHPPVNEYHPPVVSSKPAHKDALRWMLQPPPPAKVMEGKVPVSRSTSVASSITGPRRPLASAGGSEVSLTRRKALEARLRLVDSANSGATVTGRPHASSSCSVDDAAAEAAAGAALTANLSRTVSRKSTGGAPQRLGSSRSSAAARSRSGSLASSVEEPNWSSDEDGLLRTKWRFPTSAPPPIPAMPPIADLGGAESVFASQRSRHGNGRTKLKTILSSAASGASGTSGTTVKTDAGATGGSDETSRSSTTAGKENTRPAPIETATTTTDTASTDNYDAKAPHERSAGSSLDSGLALTS